MIVVRDDRWLQLKSSRPLVPLLSSSLGDEDDWKYPLLLKVYWLTQLIGFGQVCFQSLMLTSYTSTELYGGDGRAPHSSKAYARFLRGLRFGTAGYLVVAAVGVVTSLAVTRINHHAWLGGVRRWYRIGCLGVTALPVVLCLNNNNNKEGGNGGGGGGGGWESRALLLVFCAVYGFVLVFFFNNYWMILEAELRRSGREDKRGYCVSLANLAMMYGSLSVALFGGLVSKLVGFLKALVYWSAACALCMVACFAAEAWLCRRQRRQVMRRRHLKDWLQRSSARLDEIMTEQDRSRSSL